MIHQSEKNIQKIANTLCIYKKNGKKKPKNEINSMAHSGTYIREKGRDKYNNINQQ